MKISHFVTVKRSCLQRAQDIVKKNHYLKSAVSPLAYPFAYSILYKDEVAGYAIFGTPNYTKRKGLFGYDGLPTKWQVLTLYRFWIDPAFQGYLNNGHSFCLASCAIAKILRRINADWLQHHPPRYPHLPYEIELILAYADPSIGHQGTIYKAANFQYWGETISSNSDRNRHGQKLLQKTSKKLLFVYYLKPSKPSCHTIRHGWGSGKTIPISVPEIFATDLIKIARIWDKNFKN